MKRSTKLLKTPVVAASNTPVVQPIYQTSLFRMPTYRVAVETESQVHPIAYYSRWGNPTVSHLENQLSNLLETDGSLIFPSGMSAITTTMFALAAPGQAVAISDSLYGDTTRFFLEDLAKWGVEVHTFDQSNAETLRALSPSRPFSFVYYEALTNPDLKPIDLPPIQEFCRERSILSICDSTFVPPFMLRQGARLADIIIMSLTKYVGGHSSAFGGSVSAERSLCERIWHTQSLYGAAIDPGTAATISQGLKTLELRISRQSKSALRLAEVLSAHPRVEHVIYPGLPNYAFSSLADRYIDMGGGVLSFFLRGDESSIARFIESVKVVQISVSLGGLHSCIEHAEAMSHSMLKAMDDHVLDSSRAQRPDAALMRLSVGVEDVTDLEADVLRALEHCEGQ